MAPPMPRGRSSWRFNMNTIIMLSMFLVVCVLVRVNLSFVHSSSQAALEPRLRQVDRGLPQGTTKRERRTIVLIANYRDTARCAETLQSMYAQASQPDLLSVSIFDQIYEEQGEGRCYDAYCDKVGEANCRRSQLRRNDTINALHATGPTFARYQTEKGIDLAIDTFSLAIDSHIVFVPHWDKDLIEQWDSLQNEKAIITVYPRSTDNTPRNMDTSLDTTAILMCTGKIETEDADAMISYDAVQLIPVPEKPRLMSQFAGGFNFGTAIQALEVRNDPYTPYLFHGEEYSKAARLFTHGYDMYVPKRQVVYHWYEKRNVVWERDWGDRYVVQQKAKRRIRTVLGLSTTSDDYDKTDIDKFGLGTKRTFEQFRAFSGIDPTAAYYKDNYAQFNNCRDLEYVPYND
ncbi:hypothetical protein SPRG_06353 [Saprolegnia parasitica CBS 223.65]|uniref:Glycosyltransferase 2-like domain-containing protein n=1 Tax=Saprolegnia parasitica (strain CBS 223.65) TaxID=695850 RepID=A0A067CCU8_SAPPC|nr:hypothetical protein SPRG_06353 [Saprolegnia parasitica CBS 223.65]KDO28303.1 hypothetical protein SPRG_06353 [Saprolegnia parasitica CBS 223.65]|eukprot:XP_012201122.1 hypothetical protein SPRG_06353 [Saprolegnia parasitica CBS 223.65]